jgi:hypothetical protein
LNLDQEASMDLFCPHCTRRVSIPDDKAGQVLSCPLCAKQFMAPALAPPPAPIPPAPPRDAYTVGAAPSPSPSATPAAPPSQPEPVAPPPPPLPPGDYTRSFSFVLNDRWLAFVPAVCMGLIFVLSFFTWHQAAPSLEPPNPAMMMWELGWSAAPFGQGPYLAYSIFLLPCLGLTVVALVFHKGWLFTPPQLAPVMTLKNLLVGLLLGLAFLMLCIDYADAHFRAVNNPLALALKIAVRLHFLAVIASFLLFWLDWRKKSNLPLPKVECRW